MGRLLPFLFALFALLPAACGRGERDSPVRPVPEEAKPVLESLPPFQGVDQLGRRISLDDVRGKVLIVNFIYTECPAECPLISALTAGVQEQLRAEGLLGSQAAILSFSTDPFRDTPSVLAAYARRFNADADAWRFVTGRPEEQVALIENGFRLPIGYVNEAGEEFDPFAGPRPATYQVVHALRFLVADREGIVRRSFRFGTFEPADLAREVADLVRS